MVSKKYKKNRATGSGRDEDESLEDVFLERLGDYEAKARHGVEEGGEAEPQQRPDNDSLGSFGEFVEGAERLLDERDESEPSDSDSSAERESPSGSGRNRVSHEDLMAAAFDAIGDSDATHAAKYRGVGYKVDDDIEVVDDHELDDLARKRDDERSGDEHGADELMFFELMASEDVEPIEQKQIEPPAGAPKDIRWLTQKQITEKDLLEPEVTAEQRERLKRSRKVQMPVLNIRMMRRREAMDDVEVFVRASLGQSHRFVRVITGKGRNSEELPVLKRAVIDWVENGPGHEWVRGWAPETDQSGNYGSVVLELPRRR